MRIEFIGKTKATFTAIDIQSLKMGQTDVVPAVCVHLKVTTANHSLAMLDKNLLKFLFQKGVDQSTQQALDGIPVVSDYPALSPIAEALGALNWDGEQTTRAVEKHVCPLQFDIVDRLIERYSNPGETVYDPFHGLGTVGVRAIRLGRRARGSELSAAYFADQVHYLRAAEREMAMPSLFDSIEAEPEAA